MLEKYNKRHFFGVLKSILIGLFLYTLTGLLLAFVIVTFFGSDHPHSIDGVLYFIIPIFYGITGIGIGLIFALIRLRDFSMIWVVKKILLSLTLMVLVSILYFVYI
ncbi:hypothetical protein [Aquimarina mytili]|uniref:Uncharacterized protein n=1 Tax=Aquimarina mytili TaxID=874423 RepID=A0A937A791_9FLAO|nr:hypothetical protein [Aquimarina mytili]MBL0685534.1 hypothetical protein [Aquimarina mytili]